MLLEKIKQNDSKKNTEFDLFDNFVVVCFVAVNLRFVVSILDWAQNTLL